MLGKSAGRVPSYGSSAARAPSYEELTTQPGYPGMQPVTVVGVDAFHSYSDITMEVARHKKFSPIVAGSLSSSYDVSPPESQRFQQSPPAPSLLQRNGGAGRSGMDQVPQAVPGVHPVGVDLFKTRHGRGKEYDSPRVLQPATTQPDALLRKSEVVKATRAAAAPMPRRLESIEDDFPVVTPAMIAGTDRMHEAAEAEKRKHAEAEAAAKKAAEEQERMEAERQMVVAEAEAREKAETEARDAEVRRIAEIRRKEEEEAKKQAAAAATAAAKQEVEAKKAAEEQRKIEEEEREKQQAKKTAEEERRREKEEREKQEQAQEAAKRLQREVEDAMADGVITAEEQRQIDAKKAELDAAQQAHDQATAAKKAAEEQRKKEEEEAKKQAAAVAAKQEAEAKKAAEEQRKIEEEEREKQQAKKDAEEKRREEEERRMLQEDMTRNAREEAAIEAERQARAERLQGEAAQRQREDEEMAHKRAEAIEAARKKEAAIVRLQEFEMQFRSDLESGVAEAKQKKEAAALAKRNALAAAQAAEKEKVNNELQLRAKEKELQRERAYDFSVLRARQIQEVEEYAKRQQAEEVARKEEAKRQKMLAVIEASEKAEESNIAETGILYKAENRGLVITGLKSGTNAADSDFKVGDVIIQLDDDFVVGMTPYEFKMRIRGERGSLVDVVGTRVENHGKKRVSDLIERDVVLPPMQAEPGVKLKVTSSSATVTQVFEATSAEHEGILVGDQIIMIDDEFVTGIDAKEIAELMRGLAGTDVDIVLLRMKEGKKQRHEIQVMRDHNLVALPLKSRYGETGPGYICMHLCLTCTKTIHINSCEGADAYIPARELVRMHPCEGMDAFRTWVRTQQMDTELNRRMRNSC
jgi:C-terminal processing protease CtpA/Prc